MSELKAFNMPRYAGEFTMHEVYLKSEVDKVIDHHKYKRCLWTAMWCKSNSEIYNEFAADADDYMPSYATRFRRKAEFYQRWRERWLELAEVFK